MTTSQGKRQIPRLKIGTNNIMTSNVEESCKSKTFGHTHPSDQNIARLEVALVCRPHAGTVTGSSEGVDDANRIAEEEDEGVKWQEEEAQCEELDVLPGMRETRGLGDEH